MGLTYKRRMFVEYYLGPCKGNATESARKAGYAEPKQEGSRLLSVPEVRALIDADVTEQGMETAEILARIADQASSNVLDLLACMIEDVLEIDGQKVVRQRIDPEEIERRGLGHLIRKITPNKYGYIVEMYDAQRALELLAKVRGLLRDRLIIDGPVDYSKLTDDQLRELAAGRRPKGL